MQGVIILNRIDNKVAVRVKGGHGKPHPLCSPKQGNGMLDRAVVRRIAYAYKLAEELKFDQSNQCADIDMTHVDLKIVTGRLRFAFQMDLRISDLVSQQKSRTDPQKTENMHIP